ncbi:zinc metallopeptidase [Phosphitispora fastidiosa]|uniref:zinc metallopeptidase n=1 Tax=Phosphitispora fastidiosa TaxID=2837202 RepID=UPI001E5FA243|nr:zinc metallopeptidase [Phosphitispora fastidiosa]MBU7006615.1 Zn-dependent membrane protease YugP [Phosphitispora fastidiosa]
MFPFLFFEPTMLILIPGLILAMYAQFKVKSTFARYLRVKAASGYTGAQVAKKLLEEARIHDVTIEQTGGHLSDHYDPRKKVLRLSQEVYNGSSLASLGVAAHETGHAMQHHNGYLPLNIRANLVPVAQIGSTAAFPIFFIGLIFQTGWLLTAGIYLFTAVVLFQIVTLPVEFNASSRALAGLERGGYISAGEAGGAKKVLNAAALTYVAAVLMSLLQLVRLLVLSGMFGNRDD